MGAGGPEVPVIGQGTWKLEQTDRTQAIAALRHGLDLGLTHIDTAEMYGDGAVEELVAEAIDGRRDDVYLVSKVWPTNATRRGTIEACERSLKRLRTDRLDLYLLHHPSTHPLQDTLAAFERLADQGKIRQYGVSNFHAPQLRRALKLAGPGKIACNQMQYHLRERYVEAEIQPLCEAHGVALVAYSPFGDGNFPGSDGDDGRVLVEIGQALGISPRAVALAYLTRHPGSFAIPRATTLDHLEQNARGDVALTEAQCARIDRTFVARVGLATRARSLLSRLLLPPRE